MGRDVWRMLFRTCPRRASASRVNSAATSNAVIPAYSFAVLSDRMLPRALQAPEMHLCEPNMPSIAAMDMLSA